MTPEEREELRALVREEPTVSATFETLDVEFSAAVAHAESLGKRRAELLSKLGQINSAKQELADAAPTTSEFMAADKPVSSNSPSDDVLQNQLD